MPTLPVIDLESRFGGYEIGYEDPEFEATQDPWHKVIRCKRGHICPAGGTKLWACTNNRRNKAARAMLSGELPGVIKMDGDDGINFEFDVSDYRLVFDLMGAKER